MPRLRGGPPRPRVLLPVALFVATLVSVSWTGAVMVLGRAPETLVELVEGWVYALPLMAILTCHELGHYVAARIHGVPASLPYFLPLPMVSPFGTMGAIIAMPDRIRSRNALLDIGAAGPIAGMVVALPVLLTGLSLSSVVETRPEYVQEGQSLLYWLLKRVTVGPLAEGHDVLLHPTAFAGWVGLFVTMINLVPWGQLDGGHVAFALFGSNQNRYALWVRRSLLGVFVYNVLLFVEPSLRGRSSMPLAVAVGNAMPWLIWFLLLGLMGRFMGREHPPCEPGALTKTRRYVALGCLVLFAALFMPTPMANGYESEDVTSTPANLRRSASETTSAT